MRNNMDELSIDYPLTDEQIAGYRRDGFVKLPNVLSPAVLKEYGAEFTRLVHALNRQTLTLAERNTYGKAFLQIPNLWEHSEKVKRFVLCRRLGKIAAELMGVDGVRMYHDQALYKEPGGGFTPWHVDQFYWPLSNDNTVTAWIPLQEVPLEMGPLSFCTGSHKLLKNRDLSISDESERKIGGTLHDYPKSVSPFAMGEISFHSGWTFHRAGPNQSDRMRAVMTIIYMEDGMRVAPPKNENQQRDWDRWLPGAQVGEPIDTPLNPVIYSTRE
ncbi:MAG: phytanoyl-CoA dioxygenase family protein [Caldilineaceae bacterium]|nr:phytanoyl-CoA dioxygenase family protein [Caldilineaceae bacterium]